MDLLKYEFMKALEGSYNYNVGQLIKKIRYYRQQVAIDEFKVAIPQLKVLEKELQKFDNDIGGERRNYIEEIMEELDKESEIEGKVIDEIERSSRAINATLYDTEFSMHDFAYEFRNNEAISWIEFYGYKIEKQTDGTLLVIKEIFRSVCYKYGIVFIDSSLGDK